MAIGTVDIVFGGWNLPSTVRRLIAVALLVSIVLLIVTQPHRVLRNYCLLLGSLGTVTIVGLVSVLRGYDATALVNPVSLLALWILYGFVRLPLPVALLAGSVGSVFSMMSTRLTNMPEPGIRTFIYLLVANALGMLLARSIEVRERQLFLQRQALEGAKAELERRTIDAEHASAEKTRLIAAVGHDLRQPMLAAVLHSEVLRQRLSAGDSAGTRRQAERVEQSVQVLGDTLEHLLTAARYDSGTDRVHIGPVLVSSVFHRIGELFHPQACARGVSLRVREPEEGLMVLTDEHALLRIVMNLVSNAIKFTPPRQSRQTGVVLRARLKDGTTHIVVADTGLGIAEEDLEAIWQPFFQVGNQERNRSKGLGLGLYLVKQSLARLAGHAVTVRSTRTRGTRFDVSMPGFLSGTATADAAKVTSEESSRSQEDWMRGIHVLLIEDDQEAREAIEAQLDEWGAICSSGISVEQALQSCSERGLRSTGSSPTSAFQVILMGQKLFVLCGVALGTFRRRS